MYFFPVLLKRFPEICPGFPRSLFPVSYQPESDPFRKLPDPLEKHIPFSEGFPGRFLQAVQPVQLFFPMVVALSHNISSSHFQKKRKQFRTCLRKGSADRPGGCLPGTFMPVYQFSYLIDRIIIKTQPFQHGSGNFSLCAG